MTTWDPDGPGPKGEVLVIGGWFDVAGTISAGNIVTWDGSSWHTLGSGMDSFVLALAIYQGELIAGGNFVTAGGVAANRIARWDGSAWQPLGSGLNGAVRALAVHDGKLFVGGSFTTAGGSPASRIASWDGSNWQALGSGMENHVRALHSFGGYLVAGGEFATAGGVPVNRIARWNGLVWQGIGSGMGPSGTAVVRALATFNGELVAAGDAFTSGGELLRGIGHWNGIYWQGFGSGFFGGAPPLYTVCVMGEKLIAGGSFYSAGGNSANNIAEWDGSAWHTMGAGIEDWNSSIVVRATAVYQDRLFATGIFELAGGHYTNYIAEWDGTDWGPVVDGLSTGPTNVPEIRSFTQYEGELVGAGLLYAAGPEGDVQRIGRWAGAGWRSLFDSAAFNIQASFECVAEHGGALYAGGAFAMTASGETTSNIARWDGTEWGHVGGGLTGGFTPFVQTFGSFRGGLVVGGTFTGAGGTPVGRIAQWDGEAWHDLGGGVSGTNSPTVSALIEYEGDLIVGGKFLNAGAVQAGGVARWDGRAWSAMGVAPTYVEALAIFDDKLIATGESGAFWWDGRAWQSLGDFNNDVLAATVYEGELVVAGVFTQINGLPFARVARWDGDSWKPLGVGLVTSAGGGFALATYEDELVVGGATKVAGGTTSIGWARWTATNQVWIAGQPQATTIEAGETAVMIVSAAPGYGPLTYQWQREGVPVSNGPGGASVGGGIVEGAQSPDLSILNAMVSDSGVYACTVSSACGSANSDPATLQVNCYVDCNADVVLDIQDFGCFTNRFIGTDPYADCNEDAVLDTQDFGCFANRFIVGCP